MPDAVHHDPDPANGLRRSNADKRRCVEIALKEFEKMSCRAIADLRGVSNHMVDEIRPNDVEKIPRPPALTLSGAINQRTKTQRATRPRSRRTRRKTVL